MEKRATRPWWQWALLACAAVALTALLWPVLTALAFQFLAACLLMALALPICRLMEKRLSPSLAASLSFIALTLLAVGLLLLLIPPLVRQFQQLSAAAPALLSSANALLERAQAWLQEHGVNLTPVRDELFTQLKEEAGSMVGRFAARAAQVAQSAGKLFLAPLFAFYLLRDRRRIAGFLTLLVPIKWRSRAVRAAREMRRETVGFLRGQLLVSAFVGVLTAVGLLLVGTPGWLLLGLLMGVLELIPYIGPILASIPAVLLALQGGLGRALWTLAVLVGVQQLEGGLLSPRLLSGATKLHPLTVLTAISAGGMIGGTLGMLFSLPIVVSIRGAARGLRND